MKGNVKVMDIEKFWDAVLEQDEVKIRTFFHESAYVNWHCTNEHFNVNEYIQVNCEYPGQWKGDIERVETIGDLIITAVKVYSVDELIVAHAVTFFKLEDNKIIAMDEYWGDDGVPPQWRLDKKIV